jgi:hypothetical protein
MTSPNPPRPIETFTLLTEATADLETRYHEYFAFYKPASPGERELMEMAVSSSIERRRIQATVTELANDQIRTALFRHDTSEEDRVQHYRDMLPTRPDRAILELRRLAPGCRFLIERLERIITLLSEEGTLYGNDRNEAIRLCGARAEADRECLFESTGAYLVWLYALAAQPAPKDEDFIDLGNARYMPEELRDRQTEHWLGPPEVCRELLVALFERMLADVRERERVLRTAYAEPSRAGAEVREQVLRGPDGMQLAALDRMHRQNFLQAYQAFLKGRKESRDTGAAPGAPVAEVADSTTETLVPATMTDAEAAAGRKAAKEETDKRKQAADTLAAGGTNGTGARIFNADEFRAEVRARAAAQPQSTPPADAGDTTGEYI